MELKTQSANFMDMASKVIAKKRAGDSVVKAANTPSTALYFIMLRKNIDETYAKYSKDLSDNDFTQFKNDIFNVMKTYKLEVDEVTEEKYNDTFAKCGVMLVETCRKYGINLTN